MSTFAGERTFVCARAFSYDDTAAPVGGVHLFALEKDGGVAWHQVVTDDPWVYNATLRGGPDGALWVAGFPYPMQRWSPDGVLTDTFEMPADPPTDPTNRSWLAPLGPDQALFAMWKDIHSDQLYLADRNEGVKLLFDRPRTEDTFPATPLSAADGSRAIYWQGIGDGSWHQLAHVDATGQLEPARRFGGATFSYIVLENGDGLFFRSTPSGTDWYRAPM